MQYFSPPSMSAQDKPHHLPELESLCDLKNRTETLIRVKHSIFQNNESLDRKQALLDDVISEKQQLLREKRTVVEMLQGIQRDIEAATAAELALTKERDDLQDTLIKLRNDEYEPLKTEVDSLRLNKGLKRLPNLQEELDTQMAKYLEDRRERWRDCDSEGSSENRGSPVAAGAGSSSLHATGNGAVGEAGPSTTSRRRVTATSKGRPKKRQR
ncbi:hypothetical protein BC936DRAFT_138836 [Jimgerdemannia flammicorona]|uniref:Uncharacterized protein n=1 Tax=Jimgerdemannia flammicorona TaxID=994334 RepID=A0A433BGK4_9FUNG|nr:hypothetical protein BC936DRAFT_138836 [Jimgerdemannia flammicorona]